MRRLWIVVGCVWLAGAGPAGAASATLRIDPAVEGRPVSLHLDSATVEQALAELLRNSDVNCVAVGLETMGPRGPIRIVAGDPRAAAAAGDLADTPTKAVLQLEYGAPVMPSDAEMIDNKERERLEGVKAEQQSEGDVPGQTTSAEWEQALLSPTGARTVRQGLVMLPFADENGVPHVEDVGTGPRPTAMLPFVDEAGQPIIVPAISDPGAPVMLPFTEGGVPVMVPPTAPPPRPPGR